MALIVFLPGEVRQAKVPVNVVPAGLGMQLEVWLGPANGSTKNATSGKVNFTSTVASQDVTASVTMPAAGTYTVFIDVLYGGVVVKGLTGTDQIATIGVTVGPIVWS